MPITNDDFSIILSTKNSTLVCVIGNRCSFSIIFNNNSFTNPLYNISLDVILPDGLSFVSSSELESSNIIDSNFNNVISFINLKDLYINETGYKLDLTVKADEYFRSDDSPVEFNYVIQGLEFLATADSAPRGNFDSGNIVVSTQIIETLKTLKYSVNFIGPTKYIKGAGASGSNPLDAPCSFGISLCIINNTREESSFEMEVFLANGIRYIGKFSTSGTDALNFKNPTIHYVSSSSNTVSISITNAILSISSVTYIYFYIAIWERYTLNGVENSGSIIENHDSLFCSVSFGSSQNSSYMAYWSLKVVLIIIEILIVSDITDIEQINKFTLLYTTGEYVSLEELVLEFIIADGLSYIENSSSIITSDVVKNIDNTVSLFWNLGTISANITSSISLNVLTDNIYSNGNYVYSTDTLSNVLEANFIDPYTLNLDIEKNTKILTINSPTITKRIIDYYDNNLSVKNHDIATVGDYVGFKIIYDATTIKANQNNVSIFDYAPYNFNLSSVPVGILTTGDFPVGVVPFIVPFNGLCASLGILPGNSYFELNMNLETIALTSNNYPYNLGKMRQQNTELISTSFRDNIIVNFGTPNLTLNSSISGENCLSLNNKYVYTIFVKNLITDSIQNVTDGYNMQFTSTIPSIMSLNISDISITGKGTYSALELNNNIVQFKIDELLVNQMLTIKILFSISQAPVMGAIYYIRNLLTPGTSQSDINSYQYKSANITNSITLKACNPSISKIYLSDTIIYGQSFETTIILTCPSGVLAYNLSLIDILPLNNYNISNLTVNNLAHIYSVIDGKLKITLANNLDTSSGQKNFSIKFNNAIYITNSVNFEQNFNLGVSTNWENLSQDNNYSIVNQASLLFIKPGITLEKLQNNITLKTGFIKQSIPARLHDIVLYKFVISNIGCSTAYNLKLIDVLSLNLQFIRFIHGTGQYSAQNRNILINLHLLEINNSVDIIFECRVVNSPENIIAMNMANISFDANPSLDVIQETVSSNNTYILNQELYISKEQRNKTTHQKFSKLLVSCTENQVVQYKVLFKNLSNSTLLNMTINDFFPAIATFLSFEATNLNILISGNRLSIYISELMGGGSLEFMYNIILKSNVLTREYCYASATFEIENQGHSFTEPSNIICTEFSTLGRGFQIY